MTLKTTLALAAAMVVAGAAHAATELVIATVNNGQMIEMQKPGRNSAVTPKGATSRASSH